MFKESNSPKFESSEKIFLDKLSEKITVKFNDLNGLNWEAVSVDGKKELIAYLRASTKKTFNNEIIGIIESVWVCKKHQFKGMAIKLLQMASKKFTELGVKKVKSTNIKEAKIFWETLVGKENISKDANGDEIINIDLLQLNSAF